MASDRRSTRRGTEAIRAGRGLADEALSPRRLARGETTEEAPGEPGEPAGFGTEASTSSTDDVELDTYEVPEGRTGRLIEAAIDVESNGEATVHVNGIEYGPFTGIVSVNLPFDGAFLTEGSLVKVTHESTNGTSTTTQASVTVQEV